MNTLLHADIFFIISSIGFVIFFILIAMILSSILRLTKKVERIAEKVEQKVDAFGDEAEELLADLQDSLIFRMFFGGRSARKTTKVPRASRKKE